MYLKSGFPHNGKNGKFFIVLSAMADEKSKEKILFFIRYFHTPCLHDEMGSFVTSEGNLYQYDFKGLKKAISNKEFLGILNKMMSDPGIKPRKKCNKEEIIKAHEMAGKIDQNLEMRTISTANDFGIEKLCAVYENHLIILAIVGDSSNRIECDEAQEIFEILKKNDVYQWEIAGRILSYDSFYILNFSIPIYEKI